MSKMANLASKARFRRRSFHEPNLIPWIKYMKSSASESIKNGSAVLPAWLGREFRLWNDFVTALIQTPNFSCAEPNA